MDIIVPLSLEMFLSLGQDAPPTTQLVFGQKENKISLQGVLRNPKKGWGQSFGIVTALVLFF